VHKQGDRQADIQAMGCSDYPVATDDGSSAKVTSVPPLQTDLPWPRVRVRFFSANDARMRRTNSTLHGGRTPYSYDTKLHKTVSVYHQTTLWYKITNKIMAPFCELDASFSWHKRHKIVTSKCHYHIIICDNKWTVWILFCELYEHHI